MKYYHLSNCLKCGEPIYGPHSYKNSERPVLHYNCDCKDKLKWDKKFQDLENYKKEIEKKFKNPEEPLEKSEKKLLKEVCLK